MTKAIAGPDPNPVKPKYVPPPGACDAHCHIFGPAAKFPYAPERRYTPPDSPKEKLRALHEHLGFSRAVLVQASCHGADNRAMLDAIAWSGKFEPGGAWRGVAMIGDDVAEPELEALHAGGVRGVRFNFVRHLGGAPDARALERTLAMVEPLGWHVVLHFDAEDIESHAELFRRARVPFVIDHMGRVQAARGLDQRPFRMLLDLMKNPLAWVKVSGPERVSAAGKPFTTRRPSRRRWSSRPLSACCGNRLSPSQREDHAERRRAGRLLRESRPGREAPKTDPGGQPRAALLDGREAARVKT